MASFFQPPLFHDPAIERCGASQWKIYCNAIIPSSERLVKSYQYATFVLACVGIGLPVLFSFTRRLYHVWRKQEQTSKRGGKDRFPKGNLECLGYTPSLDWLSSVQSFHILDKDAFASKPWSSASDYHLYVVPLPSLTERNLSESSFSALSSSSQGEPNSKPILGLVALHDLGLDQTISTAPATAKLLLKMLRGTSIAGFVFQTTGLTEKGEIAAMELLEILNQQRVPILLKYSHDDKLLDRVNLRALVGIIIDNVCIYPNGERRDYFHSQRVRDVMAQCVELRVERPGFFVGFHDLWHTQPSAAVVVRAKKIATHFNAVLEHGPLDHLKWPVASKMPVSISGFQYLRRPETSEIQSTWMQRKRTVRVMPSDGSQSAREQVASLPFGELLTLIPSIDKLLFPLPLPKNLQTLRTRCPAVVSPPEFVRLAPKRIDFWDFSANGEQVSFYGCVPLITGGSARQYEAVLETQTHLRQLKMLHKLEDAEMNKTIEKFQQFQPASQLPHLVEALINGMISQQIIIYRGLGTGFTVPDNPGQFWGLSVSQKDSAETIELFISRRSPDDLSTILHTWLAHRGVSRIQRFEEELRLENITSTYDSEVATLPISIKNQIENATPAEVLFLLQQIQTVQFEHPFKEEIEKYSQEILIGETSAELWNDAHSRSFLDGSASMEDLLQRRLAYFVRLGATRLPTLANLMDLYHTVNAIIHESLFEADHDKLNTLNNALLYTYDPWESWTGCKYVDINADLFALIFFCCLRREAFEDVYLEATDRCPFFLSQPDQAAVFSELWALGSQCQSFFGMLPRDFGDIVYSRYRLYMQNNPLPEGNWDGKNTMTVYSKPESGTVLDDMSSDELLRQGFDPRKSSRHLRELLLKFGALSIFCLPAIIDVALLTFVGRGLFMTAWMNEFLEPACYALLISLLLSAGVTGWVGSVGNYYLYNYAYDNMIYFHVQRLSGGFVLTVVVGIVGLLIFLFKRSASVALVFFAYIMVIATYLNVLGVMATMHHPGSPLTSGRTVLWRTMPLLFISPIISTIWSGQDLQIYLPVIYGFLVLVLFQYRRLCHEWSTWGTKIPKITEKDILDWYMSKNEQPQSDGSSGTDSEIAAPSPDALKKKALIAFRHSVESYNSGFLQSSPRVPDPVVSRVVKGLAYIDWLLQKDDQFRARADIFSIPWFTQMSQALENQQKMAQGLKEHSAFMLFRQAQFDISLNVGLFLICLMDRWVNIVMSAVSAPLVVFFDETTRYAYCFAVLYFCTSVIVLDACLQKHWQETAKTSEEKINSYAHAKEVAKCWERRRRLNYISGLFQLVRRLLFLCGCCTICIWLLVNKLEILVLYYAYIAGYSAVIIFQFNRCFTTNLKFHNASILTAAAIGFVTGCVLHATYHQPSSFYTDVISLNVAAITAAILTSIWTWKDFGSHANNDHVASGKPKTAPCWKQPRIVDSTLSDPSSDATQWRSFPGTRISSGTPGYLSERILEILHTSTKYPNKYAAKVPWSHDLMTATSHFWSTNRIVLNLSSSHDFSNGGFQDAASFARYDGHILEITVGFINPSDLYSPSALPLCSYMLAESIVYHASIAIMKFDASRALHAEHILMETNIMSRRIEVELLTENSASLLNLQRNTNVQLMKHLCLGVDVDSAWPGLSVAVREAIICRILGKPVSVSPELREWMAGAVVDLQTGDFLIGLYLAIYQKLKGRQHEVDDFLDPGDSTTPSFPPAELHCAPVVVSQQGYRIIWQLPRLLSSVPVGFTKWVGVITCGDSNVEREMSYSLRHILGRSILLWITLSIWRLCLLIKNTWVYVFLIYHRRSLAKLSRIAKKGALRSLHKNTVVVELPRKVITGVSSRDDQGSLILDIFDGALTDQKLSPNPVSKATYDDHFRLVSRQDPSNLGTRVSTYTYSERLHTRWPTSKDVIDGDNLRRCFYDTHGRVYQGTLSFGPKRYKFQYFYKASPDNSHEVLKAEFRLIGQGSGDSLTVYWGVPLRQDVSKKLDWVPSDRVCRVIRRIHGQTYTTTSSYQHRYDPVMITTLEGRNVPKGTLIAQPPKVFDEEQFMLRRPADVSFEIDDLLIHHSRNSVKRIHKYAGGSISTLSLLNPTAWMYWRQQVVYRRVPTWWLRTELWNNWLKTGTLDAMTACWMDEFILREEPLLKRYWGLRSCGRLQAAEDELDANVEQIVAAIEIEKDVSEVCLLPIKSSDLYAMGLGNDANEVTTRPQDCFNDTENRISVIFNDIGCWPESPGGVSNCRRDLVNGHSTIRNHVLAESGNDYGTPRFQVEKNVQSLKILPLWGLDGKTPRHGIIDNLLQSEVDQKIDNTDITQDVVGTFVPLLKTFVKGARSREISRNDIITCSNAMLTMSKYFEHKDYGRTWNSKEVASAWQEAWLAPYNDPNVLEVGDSFQLERPSQTDFRDALAIYSSYFFIFSVQTPENCPKVFQSTHHGISSLFGMLLKYRRGATFGIWDHAILWRECCLNISPAQSQLSIPVQYMLLSGIALATKLAYFHADIVLPCTSFFNPIWEAELGTDSGRLGNRKQFSRKIDPIINGVSDMDSFQPVDKVRSKVPTVVMLSNVQFIKDIKTAILSADIIINKYGFKDYQLVVYGSQNREPDYAIEMAKLITQCNLDEKVKLAGFGNAQEVLKDAWVFMNSSLSEGLPLAIAEAALAGVPIVATAVGATSLVLTDPDNPNQQYGEVVPPNDPTALARAQLNMLAMLGPWARFTGDMENIRQSTPIHLTLPDVIREGDVERLTRRIYEKAEDRRQLGLLSRQTVLRGFHGKRYLREHEQMYWIQWHLARMRANPALAMSLNTSLRFDTPEPMRYIEMAYSETGTRTGMDTDTEATSVLQKLPRTKRRSDWSFDQRHEEKIV